MYWFWFLAGVVSSSFLVTPHRGYGRFYDMFSLLLMAFPQDVPDTFIVTLSTTRVDDHPCSE